jgi:succinyl-CoA synthetase alpha subunit
MSTYRLDRLFAPKSIALIGASPRPSSAGRAVLRNLRDGGFQGALHLVNPHYDEIEGIRAVKSFGELPLVPDLAIIAAPPPAVPAIVAAAGERGTAGAIIITAGLGHGKGSLATSSEQAARAKGLRLIGPNCLGVLVPPARLNASFAASTPIAGDLALISQSGAIAVGLVEWAAARAIGFSAIVSLGDSIDVDFGDLIDFFSLDRSTRAILLYVESIRDARKFMSAARAAARSKPVVVVKSGRHQQGAKAAQTHTGALAGADAVYDAAFRRAGLLRVIGFDELFAAAETLGRLKPFPGKRLAILTNQRIQRFPIVHQVHKAADRVRFVRKIRNAGALEGLARRRAASNPDRERRLWRHELDAMPAHDRSDGAVERPRQRCGPGDELLECGLVTGRVGIPRDIDRVAVRPDRRQGGGVGGRAKRGRNAQPEFRRRPADAPPRSDQARCGRPRSASRSTASTPSPPPPAITARAEAVSGAKSAGRLGDGDPGAAGARSR